MDQIDILQRKWGPKSMKLVIITICHLFIYNKANSGRRGQYIVSNRFYCMLSHLNCHNLAHINKATLVDVHIDVEVIVID